MIHARGPASARNRYDERIDFRETARFRERGRTSPAHGWAVLQHALYLQPIAGERPLSGHTTSTLLRKPRPMRTPSRGDRLAESSCGHLMDEGDGNYPSPRRGHA